MTRFGRLAVLGCLVSAFLLAACSDEDNTVDLGLHEEIPLGEVTTFRDVGGDTGRWEELPSGATQEEPIPIDLHVVSTGEPPFTIDVFLGRDPHSGCPVSWDAEHEWDGEAGWFVADCTGSIFNREGERVFGPSPRNLDRLGADINDEEHLVVDLDVLVLGDDRRQTAAGDATPTPAPTRTAAATPTAVASPMVRDTVWLAEAATGEVMTLTDEEANVVVATFAEDGESVLVAVAEPASPLTWTQFDLSGASLGAAPPPGGCSQTDDGAAVIEGREYPGARCGLVSPDRTSMFYEVGAAQFVSSDAWLLDLETGDQTRVQEGLVHCGGCDGSFGPTWSSSGRYVTYAETGGDGRVFLTDASTGATRVLTHGNVINEKPEWSPTTDEIVFPGATGTMLLDTDSGAERQLSLAWPARWDPTGRYLYSPAWDQVDGAGGETTIVEAGSSAVVDVLPGEPSGIPLWTGTVNIVGIEDGGYTAALEDADECDGTTLYSTLRGAPLCVEDGSGATISPDGTKVALAVMVERGLGPLPLTRGFDALMTRFEIVLVDVATGDRRVIADNALSYDDSSTRGDVQPPAITWNNGGSHFLVRWPAKYGI